LDDLGEDFFSGGPGDDVISVAGFGPGPPELFEESDEIVCGGSLDGVDAHPSDVVADDCKEVNLVPTPSRSLASGSGPERISSLGPTPCASCPLLTQVPGRRNFRKAA